MPDITITVTGTPPDGSYSSSSPKVDSDGNIQVNPGITSIQFNCGSGQSWSFQDPYISFDDPGPFTKGTCTAGSVNISDDDPGGGQDRTYEYTLHTTEGDFDPQIINKG